ncbi:MAG TPA: hypothetical protein VGT98_09305, partial [Candidatus Elarobacter sp.]|nr:hypothetical protein [Candidatus Elarobacter sp.]
MMGFIEGGSHVAFSPGATTPVTADAFVVNAADVFTQEVATETRHQLGARGDTLPLADSVTTWRGIGNGLIVIMRRDG